MKLKKIQTTIASSGVVMDRGDENLFLVYSYGLSHKGLNNYHKIIFA